MPKTPKIVLINSCDEFKVLTPRRSDKVVRIYYFILERTDKVRSVDKADPILEYSMFEICSKLEHWISQIWISFIYQANLICSFRRRWRGDFVVNFTVNNLMMTFGVKRWSSTAVEDKVWLVGYKKVNTRWIFVWGKISWFRD